MAAGRHLDVAAPVRSCILANWQGSCKNLQSVIILSSRSQGHSLLQIVHCFLFPGTDWRADGYRWRQTGTTGIPKKKPVIRKIHFQISTSTGNSKSFRKFVYSNADEEKPAYVVVQYIGDASSAENFPHGKWSTVILEIQK